MVSGIMPVSGRGACRGAAVLMAVLALPSAALAQPAAAAAAPAITIYNLNGGYTNADGITEGPDGNMWFTEFSTAMAIGEITPGGAITDHPVPEPNFSASGGMTRSPGGRDLLYTVSAPDGYIGRITTAGTASILRRASSPQGITTGPHGSIWYTTGTPGDTSGGSIVRIARQGKITTFTGPDVSVPYSIAEGPGGTMWFTNLTGSIGRITPCGHLTDFTGHGIAHPETITRGPHGDMWFTNYGSGSIGKITPSGHVTRYTSLSSTDSPVGITRGPDGAMWFTNQLTNTIGRITTSGQVTSYTAPGINSPQDITPGPHGTLWFTNGLSIGKITLKG
jgi:virginiamycin B lyase